MDQDMQTINIQIHSTYKSTEQNTFAVNTHHQFFMNSPYDTPRRNHANMGKTQFCSECVIVLDTNWKNIDLDEQREK